jgi:hypothetical protein
MNILLSIASVPPRFQNALLETLDSLACVSLHKIVIIPKCYKKWGAVDVPMSLRARTDIEIVTTQQDYGPAGKLLGAIEYARQNPGYTHILTLDDDINYKNPVELIKQIEHFSFLHSDEVLTIGGIKLIHPPYAHRNGLKVHNVGYVDMVAGGLGTLYPLNVINNDLFFSVYQSLPEGIFNDDDLYFGIVLSMLKVPIYSFATIYSVIPGMRYPYKSVQSRPDSAVQFGTDLNRIINQMQIIQYAVGRDWLPSPFTKVTLREKASVLVQESFLVAKIVSLLHSFKIFFMKTFRCVLIDY